ncbi:MAG TPA: hypothetical protein VFQ91_19435 [Bryobacteraceae bacterium]|nr:hypothetical protein [Bryobacteraceae bacterium]
MSLLIAGGAKDPNLSVLVAAAERAEVPIVDLRVPAGGSPAFHWDLRTGNVSLRGDIVRPSAAFIRMDVFEALDQPRPDVSTRALGWYQAITGWAMATGIRHCNRNISPVAANKPATLALARECGLRVPTTAISNQPGPASGAPRIAKPVAGGGYCVELGEALENHPTAAPLAMPAIVQERLTSPEVRVYVIGESAIAFELRSASLDYRQRQDAEIISLPEPPPETKALRRLMDALAMDFGAADFKTDPDTGDLVFLELNTSPMFARFDYASEGRLSRFLVESLCPTGTVATMAAPAR